MKELKTSNPDNKICQYASERLMILLVSDLFLFKISKFK